MTLGKAAAQAGHAFKLLTRKTLLEDINTAERYFSDGMGTNVCLKSKSLHHLMRAYEEAQSTGLPCVLITDSGHIHPPHFDGSPIITALGIGPCLRSDIHHITKRFSSL
jgi:PTH2 family peptidyl-tRNA hydrolase